MYNHKNSFKSDVNQQKEKWKITNVGESMELLQDVFEAVNNNNNADIQAYTQAEWEAPVTFDKYPVPPFPVNIYNEPIKSMVKHVAESIQTPIDLPSVVGLGILSACIQNKFEIIPKSGWSEPLNLYSISLLEPSTRKSAVFSKMTKPFRQYEKENREEMKIPLEIRKAERSALEKQKEVLEREYAKNLNPEILEKMKEINKRLQEIPELYLPTLMADDATPEALVSLMHENKGKISILSAEGDLIERFKNKNIEQVKYDVYLKPYSGDSLRTDRMTRSTEIIENPTMTICITAQPSVIKSLPLAVHERGLIARFIISVPYDNLGNRDSRTPEIPEDVIRLYESLIRKLLAWETDKTISLKLSEDALDLLYETMDEVEIEFRENGAFHDDLKSWAGKLIGQLLRVAGLLHISYQATIAENITDVDTLISKDTLISALQLKEYLILHAEKAFGVMKQYRHYDDAEYLLEKILNQNTPIVEKQTIHQITKKKIKGKERIQRAYDILEYHSYIKQAQGGKSGQKGLIWVNPNVLKRQ
ncbi:YfjI family protein [Rummeliibacillus sp. TYF-LIM-RU47]|uniref:YfjI family protein n=1 Tax=Rummeliibacillus sp. TYF-LIM-RU47 TaxID=2608406 RepID=UPI0012385B38|nr:YfjI family protein [Rummeliibacillus sp. TYF-LIM-RU47]